tara:strand:- start:2351 stop:2782 length:432 start_codon:yes stop_codon:yes gene_type:complete
MTLVNKFNKYFSKQAKLAVLGYVLLSIAFFLPVKDPENPHRKYNLTERALSFIVMLLPITVSIYTINCMVVGTANGGMPCNYLAWINSVSVFFWCVLVLGFTLMLLNVSKKSAEKFTSCNNKEKFQYGPSGELVSAPVKRPDE